MGTRNLRSKAQRNALWLAAGGRCALCGEPLPDGWHADHVTPWSVTRRTNMHEMQALCPACNLKKGSRFMAGPWQGFFKIDSEKFFPLMGQTQAFAWAASTQEFGPGADVRKMVQLVTGYGKTLLTYGVYAILMARGILDKLLVFVPGDEQRSQFCDDEVDARALLGIECPARAVEKTAADLAYSRRGERCVFVATYAQLNDGFFRDLLLSDGHRWGVVFDECHHLAEDNLWGSRAEGLPAAFRLYMTATPLRSDRKALRGCPTDEGNLIAKADYKVAHREEAVKQVVGCKEHYAVKCDTADSRTIDLTTEDLRRPDFGDFKTYEAKRQLRYNSDYLWELLLNPINMLAQKRAVSGPAKSPLHQMLIFAMSCRHASFVDDAVRSVCASVGFSFSCAWVGVGEGQNGVVKSDRENRETIDRYRAGDLDILISVDKIGEGFSVKTASVLVFLNLLTADNKLLQQIGRGLRRQRCIPFKDDYCHIFCGADSEVARIVEGMDQIARELREKKDDGPNGGGGGLFDIPDLTVIMASHTHREVICPITPADITKYLSRFDLGFCAKYGIDPVEHYRYLMGRAGLEARNFADDTRSSRERDEAIKAQTNAAVSTLVGNIMRVLKRQGRQVGPQTAGAVKKSVNTEWLRRGGERHDGMTEDGWREKHAWVRAENVQLKEAGRLPSWLEL